MITFKQFVRLYEAHKVDDEFFNHESTFNAHKNQTPVKHEVAKKAGTTETLEGPMRHEAGHHIMTGPKGERYPISHEKFSDMYDDKGDGTGVPKKVIKRIRAATEEGDIETSWGKMHYKPGHMIVRHKTGDYGVVDPEIFKQSYTRT